MPFSKDVPNVMYDMMLVSNMRTCLGINPHLIFRKIKGPSGFSFWLLILSFHDCNPSIICFEEAPARGCHALFFSFSFPKVIVFNFSYLMLSYLFCIYGLTHSAIFILKNSFVSDKRGHWRITHLPLLGHFHCRTNKWSWSMA